MRGTSKSAGIPWKEWSEDSFEKAKREGRLVLLDLTASWCHWCHVMDDMTYSNPEIAGSINRNFVPIRVDIDRRPDISERYNRGGFPTTAFLSDRGESIWGATFVPPTDMKRIMEAILRAKESGEIDQALEGSRMVALETPKSAGTRAVIGFGQLEGIFEGIFSAYDVKYGGFGSEPKFPHPDVLELLLTKYVETKDHKLADAVINSIEGMALGLVDKVEGGLFRYSVTRDWQTPHYEKMLETNVDLLKILVQAHVAIGGRGFERLARETANYLVTNLWNPKGEGFSGSQDADEEYYKLSARARKKRIAPSIDRTVYAGWNADASAVFMLAGFVFADEEMSRAGIASWDYNLRRLWNPRLGLVRHVASDETYLFEDQVSFFAALLTQLGFAMDDEKTGLAKDLTRGVERNFASDVGGFNDVRSEGRPIGELHTPRRQLAENSKWALALARFGSATHRLRLIDEACAILNSFSLSEIEANGLFAAAYLKARWAIDHGLVVVEIHADSRARGTENRLLTTAWTLLHPSIIQLAVEDNDQSEPYAVVCTSNSCSRKISDPEELLMYVSSLMHDSPPASDSAGNRH